MRDGRAHGCFGGADSRATVTPMAMPMKVIVNADDLGMSLVVNDAIFRAYDEGLLVSTTVLVHGPGFPDAVRRLHERPGLRVGVHLDTTEFAHPARRLLAWREQVQIAREAGIEPSHLDSHQHVHFQWRSLPALHRLCHETAIGRVRGRSLDYGPSVRSRAWRRIVQTFATMPDHYFSIEHWVACGAPARAGFTELMVHPGNPHHARYAGEMDRLARLARSWEICSFEDLPAPSNS